MSRYTSEQKEEIIKKAATIGAAAAAKAEGVSYPTVLKWVKENGEATARKVKSLPTETVAAIDEQIAVTENEIGELEKEIERLKGEVAVRKTALKELNKAREKAGRVEQKAAEAAQKKELVEEILKSGKPIEEILSLLQ